MFIFIFVVISAHQNGFPHYKHFILLKKTTKTTNMSEGLVEHKLNFSYILRGYIPWTMASSPAFTDGDQNSHIVMEYRKQEPGILLQPLV